MSSKGFLSSQRNAHRNTNAGTKRRSDNRGGRIDSGDFRGYSVQEKEIRYFPPQKRARSQAQTQTQFRSANPGTNRMYDGNCVSRVSHSYVKNDMFGSNSNNGFPFAVRNNDSVPLANSNYQKPPLPHGIPNYPQRVPFPLPYRKLDDEISLSFDSLPEWIPNEPTSGNLNGSIPNSQYNNPPINFLPKSNGDMNGGYRNHGYSPMASFNGNVASKAPAFTNFPVSMSLNNANMSSFVPQVISQSNQPLLSKDLEYLLNVLKTVKEKQETVASKKDEVPLRLDFDTASLNVRNESVINALYSDMSRQCSSCGLRFKCQEDHSNHMDWHVRKNRMEKDASKTTNARSKQNSTKARGWLASSSLWLSASTSGGAGDAKSRFNADGETQKEEEKKEHVVPVDDDQKTCALCEEPFEDFFSHEADEWMYKDAVYLNMNEQASTMTTTTRSCKLGPIVHVKCMPETPKAPAQDLKELKIVPVTVPLSGRAVVC